MEYLLIVNSYQYKYSSLANVMVSQYSMKNNQYPKDLISAAGIMRNNWNDDYGTIKTECKTLKHENSKKQNKSDNKE